MFALYSTASHSNVLENGSRTLNLTSLRTLHLGSLVYIWVVAIFNIVHFLLFIHFELGLIFPHVKQESWGLKVGSMALYIIYILRLGSNSLWMVLKIYRHLSESNLHVSTITKPPFVYLAGRLVKATLGVDCKPSTHTHCQSIITVFAIALSPWHQVPGMLASD